MQSRTKYEIFFTLAVIGLCFSSLLPEIKVLPSSAVLTEGPLSALGLTQNSTTIQQYIVPSEIIMESGTIRNGSVSEIQQPDHHSVELLSESRINWFTVESSIRFLVVFNQSIVNMSAVRIVMQSMKIPSHRCESHSLNYHISILNTQNETVYSSWSDEYDNREVLHSLVECRAIRIEIRVDAWLWEHEQSILARIDYIEAEYCIPNQSPVVLSNPQLNPTNPKINMMLDLISGSFTDPEIALTPITISTVWQCKTGGVIQNLTIANNITAIMLDADQFLVGDTIRVIQTAVDSLGLSVITMSDWVRIENTAPSITDFAIFSSESNGHSYIDSILMLQYNWTDPDPSQLGSSRVRWWNDQIALTPWQTSMQIDLGSYPLIAGNTITAQLEVSDGVDIATRNISITISNHPPEITGYISLTPACPTTLTDIVCEHATPVDPDGDTVFVQYVFWRLRASTLELIQNSTSNTISSGFTQLNDQISVEVYLNNEYWAGNASVSIANTHPSASAIVSVLDSDGNLRSDPSTWICDSRIQINYSVIDPDFQNTGVTIEWYCNALPYSSAVIYGENGSSEFGGKLQHGDIIEARIVPFDGIVVGTEIFSPKITITNEIPQILNATILPMDPVDRTSCVHLEVWPSIQNLDQDLVRTEYIWKINGQIEESATSRWLPRIYYSHGDEIQVTIRIFDIVGGTFNYGLDWNSPVMTIINQAPELIWASLPASIRSNQNLTVDYEYNDLDSVDRVFVKFLWIIDHSDESHIISTVSSTLSTSNYQKGDMITCVIQLADNFANEWMNFSVGSCRIFNTLPQIQNISILGPIYEDDILAFANLSISAYDFDHDEYSYEIRWFVNEREIEANESLGAPSFKGDDEIMVKVRIWDGENWSEWIESPQITVIPAERYSVFDWDLIIQMPKYSLVGIAFLFIVIVSLQMTYNQNHHRKTVEGLA